MPYGAGDRTRTGTGLLPRDFKSLVSTIPPHRQVPIQCITCAEACQVGRQSKTRPAGRRGGRSLVKAVQADQTLPVTVKTAMPGVVIQLPSAFWVNSAAGTVIRPGLVVKTPVVSL